MTTAVTRPFDLHIEELVLHGFAPHEGQQIQDALQPALVESIGAAPIDVALGDGSVTFETLLTHPIALPCATGSPRFASAASNALAGALSAALTGALTDASTAQS